MADGTSVGKLTLDLEIRDKVAAQLEELKNSISKMLSKPMEQAAEQAAESVQKGMEKAAESAAKKMEEGMSGAVDSVKNDIEELAREAAKVKVPQPSAKPQQKVVELTGKSATATEMGVKTEADISALFCCRNTDCTWRISMSRWIWSGCSARPTTLWVNTISRRSAARRPTRKPQSW